MKKIILLAFAIFGMSSAFAQTATLTINDSKLAGGKEYEESLFVNITSDITDGRDLQFDVYVPTNLILDGDYYTDPDISAYKSGRSVVYDGKSFKELTDTSIKGYHAYRVLIYGSKAVPTQPMLQSGSIFALWFDTTNMTSGEEFPIYIKNGKMSEHGSETASYKLTDSAANIGIDIEPTGINDIKGTSVKSNVYGIDGTKKAEITKGVNIVNGQKVVK